MRKDFISTSIFMHSQSSTVNTGDGSVRIVRAAPACGRAFLTRVLIILLRELGRQPPAWAVEA